MPLRVTIAGDIGSGKSTVAKRLAELVGVDALSTGGIQRQLAQKRGLTVLELNKLAEEDASIDRDIDSYLMGLSPGDLVVESRMAWHFVPDTLKTYLYISDKAAARRILTFAVAAHLGKVQDAFEAPAHAACRFRLRRPDRSQHLLHEARIHRLHRQRADDGIGVGGKRRAPLPCVLLVTPSVAVRVNVGFGALLERDCLRRVEP